MAKLQSREAGLLPQTQAWIDREIERTGLSRDALMASLAEEAARTRRFPGIAFRDEDEHRRAWVIGTALDVWELVESYKVLDSSIQRLLEVGDIPEEIVRRALAYYEEYPEEIDKAVAENQRTQAEWHALYPDLIPAPEA